MPTLAFEVFTAVGVVMSCQTDQHPTDREWDAYLSAIGPLQGRRDLRVLVVSEGGHPSRGQQERLREVVGTSRVKVAIISPAAGLRFVTSVMSLFNPNIRCFSPAQRAMAFAHLGVGAQEAALFVEKIERLHRQLGSRTSWGEQARP